MREDSRRQLLEQTKQLIGWESASNSAKDWWKELVQVNQDRVDLIFELAEQLRIRRASLDDFFLACCYSKKEGVRENLSFLDKVVQDKSRGDASRGVETVVQAQRAKSVSAFRRRLANGRSPVQGQTKITVH